MEKKQKQIRKIGMIALGIIAVVLLFFSIKSIRFPSDDADIQTGKYDVLEITPAGIHNTTQENISANESTEPAVDISSGDSDKDDVVLTEAVPSAFNSETVQSNDSQGNAEASDKVNQNKATEQERSQSANSNQTESPSNHGQQTQMQNPTQTAQPVQNEPQKEYYTCTIEIKCDILLENESLMTDESLKDSIPFDGVLLPKTTLKVEEGASAYDVLAQICQNRGIQLDSNYSPMQKSYYVKAIGYIYEKKAGSLSGWRYYVNEKYPNYGSSSYKVQDGDYIVFLYALDLGM